MSNLNCLMQQSPGHLPCILIGSDIAHLYLEHCRNRAQGNVCEKLVPDQLLNVLMDADVEAARIKGLLDLRKDPFCILYQHTDIGISDSAVADLAHTQNGSVIFRRSDDDVVLRNKLSQDVLMPGPVLQGHDIGVLSDQRLVSGQCSFGKKGFHEKDDQIDALHPLRGYGRARTIQVLCPVLLQDDAFLADMFHHRSVGIHHAHIIVQGQMSPVDGTHRSGTDHSYTHINYLLLCSPEIGPGLSLQSDNCRDLRLCVRAGHWRSEPGFS